MANHKSSLKRIRANEKKRIFNRYYARTMRNALRKFRTTAAKEEAAILIPKLVSLIDKNSKRGVIHKNKAANLKSGIAKRFNNM